MSDKVRRTDGAPQFALPWTEHPRKELVRLAVPMVSSLLLTTVVNAYDTWLVGNLGARELAAAGLGNSVAFTIASFSMALFAAAKVKVSESLGRGDQTALASSRAAFLFLGLGLGLLGVGVTFGASFLLESIGKDAAASRLAGSYLRLRAPSSLFLVTSAALAHHRQAEGAPRLPMQASLLAGLLHAPLSSWLCHGKLGVFGVALAYDMSRALEFGVLLLGLREYWKGFGAELSRSPRTTALAVVRVGLTTAIERVLDMAAFATVPLVLSTKDAIAVAAHQVTLQLSQLSFLPLIALSEAVSILVAQTLGGASRGARLRVTRLGYLFTFSYALVLASLFVAFRAPLAGSFTSDAGVAREAALTLLVAAMLQIVNSFYAVTKSILRGHSEFDFVAWTAVACAWGVTPPLTWLLGVSLGLGSTGAWVALLIEVTLGLAILIPRARRRLLQD